MLVGTVGEVMVLVPLMFMFGAEIICVVLTVEMILKVVDLMLDLVALLLVVTTDVVLVLMVVVVMVMIGS